MDLAVDCYAGHRGEETPRRMLIAGRPVEVLEVRDRWAGPDGRYFRLRCDDGHTYLVRHDEHADRWEIVAQ